MLLEIIEKLKSDEIVFVFLRFQIEAEELMSTNHPLPKCQVGKNNVQEVHQVVVVADE